MRVSSDVARENLARQLDILAEVEVAWGYHPDWTLGKLLQSAASIARGQIRLNPGVVTDEELSHGLRALVPDDWEMEGKK